MWRHLLRETVPLLTGPCRTAGVSTLSRHTVSSETSTCPEFISFENSPSFLGPEKIALGSMSGAGGGEAWVGRGKGEHEWGGGRRKQNVQREIIILIL